MVLARLRLPGPMLFFFHAIYDHIRCFGAAADVKVLLYLITSGVLQGCPASGVLYALAAHAFLADMHERIEVASRLRSLARACADDVGGVIHELGMLREFKVIFDM
eukprot:611261-Pyramimonas_sp.AAC.1